MITFVLNKKNNKITILQLQKICGFLNFIGRAVLPGRAFTRRLYRHIDPKLKQHHHIRISGEMRADLMVWQEFLRHPSVYCRSFTDFSTEWNSKDLNFYTDASKNPFLGFGGKYDSHWFYSRWNSKFVIDKDPSIEFLELFAVTAGILAWIHLFTDRKISLFCDNQAVVAMINNTSSKCRRCMKLIRILVLQGLIYNVKITAKYVESSKNDLPIVCRGFS